jgi:hypothetical protein
MSRNTKHTMKCTVSTLLKRHSRGFYSQPRETVLTESTQIRWFSEQSGRRLDFKDVAKGAQNKPNLRVTIRFESTQIRGFLWGW